jgi:hypothetical protein
MITGLEIAAAIGAIISAYTSTAMLVAHHRQKRKVTKDGMSEQANQLEGALNEMALTLKSELRGARGWNIGKSSLVLAFKQFGVMECSVKLRGRSVCEERIVVSVELTGTARVKATEHSLLQKDSRRINGTGTSVSAAAHGTTNAH